MGEDEAIMELKEARALIDNVIKELEGDLEPPSPNIPESELVWEGGNVWKPISESDGNAVVILRSEWPVPSRVSCLADNGVWETFRYTGIANGDRYHFRGSRTGAGYKGRRAGGGVRVYFGSGDDYVFIPFPGPPRNRWGS